MEVRQVRVSDADNLLALMNRLDNETTLCSMSRVSAPRLRSSKLKY